MKKLLLVLNVLIFITFNLKSQDKSTVLLVYKLDNVYTHVYIGYSIFENKVDTIDLNLKNYYIESLRSELAKENYRLILDSIPKKYASKLGYFNLVGKPNRKIKAWLSELYHDQGVKYVIVLDKAKLHPDSGDSFLNGNTYGTISNVRGKQNLVAFFINRILIFSCKNPDNIRYKDFDSKTFSKEYLRTLEQKNEAKKFEDLTDQDIDKAVDEIESLIKQYAKNIVKSISTTKN